MKQKIKIAIIGGSGKSGKFLVHELLKQDFHLKLLLRNSENFPIQSPLIEIQQGDVRSYESVHQLIQGCHAVISTLGQPKGESTIFSQATQHIVQGMEAWQVKRYIVTTGLNVDTPFDKKSVSTQAATDWMKSNYPETTFDKQKEYDLLSESKLDWTLVRLPLIAMNEEAGEIKTSLEDCPNDKISVKSLAVFLVKQLADEEFIRQAPFLTNLE